MKKILKNHYVFSLFTKGIMVGLGVVNSVIINRYLGPTLKGEYSYYLNIINILELILNLGIYQSYPFFRRKYGEEVKKKYYGIVFFQSTLYGTCALIVFAITRNVQLLNILMLVVIMILAKQLNFIVLVEDFIFRSVKNMLSSILYGVLLLISFFYFESDLKIVYGILYIRTVFSLLLIFFKFKIRPNFKNFDRVLFKDSIKFGVLPMLISLLVTLNYRADILILKLYESYGKIGFYTVGVGLANQVWVIPDAFKDVLFSRTAKKDSIDEINLSLKVNLYICICVIIVILLFGKALIGFLYGEEFLPAYAVTVTIFLGLIPMMFFKLIGPLFIAKGMQKVSFRYLAISVMLNVALNFVLIPVLSIVGAAVASVASYSLCGFLYLNRYRNMYDLSYSDVLVISKSELNRLKGLVKK